MKYKKIRKTCSTQFTLYFTLIHIYIPRPDTLFKTLLSSTTSQIRPREQKMKYNSEKKTGTGAVCMLFTPAQLEMEENMHIHFLTHVKK